MPASTSARPLRLRRLRRPLGSLALTPLLAAAVMLGTGGAPPAGSSASSSSSASAGASTGTVAAAPRQAVTIKSAPASTLPLRLQALNLTNAQRGKWYRWGAAGPSYFDCSGLVYYVYRTRLHRNVPRTANAQRLAAVRVAKSNVLPGDLIFFMSGGRAYHVGVYAGAGRVWHAPRTGQRVQLSRIWTSAWVAGRVR